MTEYMPADKRAYLQEADVAGFCAFLTQLIREPETVGFKHSYAVAWRPWRKLLKGDKRLEFSSLKDAFDRYYWLPPPGDDSENDDEPVRPSNFEQNSAILASLKEKMRAAMQDTEDATFIACARILDWGKVYRGSLQWTLEARDRGKLRSLLQAAVNILSGDSGSELLRFNTDLRYDSGLTKIYSLAGDNSIMYDSRVGAGLCLLVKFYLQMTTSASHEGPVPEALSFVRGEKGRNPSTSTFKFPPRGMGGFLRARSNLCANWIFGKVINEVAPLWGIENPLEQLRALEAAIFMLGYSMAGPPPRRAPKAPGGAAGNSSDDGGESS